ncbi:MAG TPA: hydrogenase maturation nickel metallochaperone HypA [Desulfobacteraceae bacterium]|nr:hydrogenase maturation nickel metallochaperone HypA [Deltaproteobacteria bacterium]RLB97079.1 MAG: hydrogenase maturation nickel metallochaperone HypA [Deltaproteobacteria bacterium]HDI59733.1 hydrogenase maturation nickel metallochaperone HypA [Desulfobacteraceae bacterium]
MHEMGLALEIIDIATASIPADLVGARVARVNLTVGKLSAVVPGSLRFCFQVASRETPLEGAELNIEEVPVVALCKECGHRWTIEEPVFRCPACDSPRIEVVSGRELDIRSIELEEKDGG